MLERQTEKGKGKNFFQVILSDSYNCYWGVLYRQLVYIVDRVGVSRGRHGDRSGRVGICRYLVGSRSRLSRVLKLKVAGPC